MEHSSARLNLNPFDPDFWRDPYRFYPELLSKPPQTLASPYPAVVCARYRDVIEVLTFHARFSSRVPRIELISKLDPFVGAATMLLSDPPEHTRLRKVMTRYLRSGRAEGLEIQIRATIDQCLERIASLGTFDAVQDFARPISTIANGELLGIPREDLTLLKEWYDKIFASVRRCLMLAGQSLTELKTLDAGSDRETERAARLLREIGNSTLGSDSFPILPLREYLLRLIERRRKQASNDLISSAIPELDSGIISIDEFLAAIMLLLFAGNDTTTGLIANSLVALCQRPDEIKRLRAKPELIDGAIEEVLRFDSPVQMVLRFATSETRLSGTSISEGTLIFVMLGAANRDPAKFNNADLFELDRYPNEHLAFGYGVHSCFGSHLARLQGRLSVAAILDRFPALKFGDAAAPLAYSGSLLSRELTCLQMRTG